MQLLLFVAVCLTHAFMAVFYLLYSFAMMIWVRKSQIAPSRNLTLLFLAIYISGLYFYTAFLPSAASTLFRSLLQASGITEYSTIYQQTAAPTAGTLVQFLSRATVIATGAVSALFLVVYDPQEAIRFRRFRPCNGRDTVPGSGFCFGYPRRTLASVSCYHCRSANRILRCNET